MTSKTVPNGDIKRDVNAQTVQKTKKEVTNLMGMYLLVAGAVTCAWALGYFEFSFLWVFMLTASLFIVWKTKIGNIIRRHLNYEEDNLHRKRALRQSESVEWLNFLLNRWWVFSSYSIEDLVKKRIDDRLIGITPPFVEKLELKAFTVGNQTPNIRNVRVYEFCEGVPGGQKPITWVSVNQPPQGMDRMSSYKLVLETDLSLHCEDFKMIFRAKVGNKKVSLGFDMSVDDLNITGTMQAIVQFCMDIPFPHISKATISFIEKPEVTFNIHMLRALQLMEVPLLKSWIHTNVMEGLTKAMVDPASVDLHFAKTGPVQINRSMTTKDPAQGVLTVKIKGTPHDDAAVEDIRYCVLRIDDRKRETRNVPAIDEWEDICSFFIYNLALDRIQIKQKCKRLLTSTVLDCHEINLSSHPFQVKSMAEEEFVNKDGSKLTIHMEYSAIPQFDLEEDPKPQEKITDLAGVLYVKIHGAANIIAADRTGSSDPYCVLFSDRRRVFTTPYIPQTRNPRWETGVEFFVRDFTQTNLSFFVFDWDGTNTIDDDFLGSAHFSLSEEESCVIKKNLILGYNDPSKGYIEDKSCGQITISAVFRPVPSVAKSEKYRALLDSISSNNNDYLYREDLMSPATSLQSQVYGKPRMNEGPGRMPSHANYMDTYLEGKTIVELTILQGKDLVAMDRNGFSDPFCVVLLDKNKVFTTCVKKKTLFPKWNETVTLELPSESSDIEIDVYDKDILGKDFMGKLYIELDKLKEISLKGTSEWFPLQRAKSGKIQLRSSVISKDMIQAKDTSFDQSTYTDVFDSSIEQSPPKKMQIPSINAMNNDGNMTFPASDYKPPVDRKQSTTLEVSPIVEMRRSISNVDMNNSAPRSRMAKSFNESDTVSMGRRTAGSGFRHAGSVNSVALGSRGDNLSMSSSVGGDKLYSVKGQVILGKGFGNYTSGEVYCKVRVEPPGHRMSLFSSTRVIAKSSLVKPSNPNFNLSFEIDRGHGISSDAVLTFDIKRTSKDHVATKGYTLRHLLAEADDTGKIRTTLPLQNNIEIEIILSHGQQTHHRKRLISNLSFRKDKHT